MDDVDDPRLMPRECAVVPPSRDFTLVPRARCVMNRMLSMQTSSIVLKS
jgi:hypothetical protein